MNKRMTRAIPMLVYGPDRDTNLLQARSAATRGKVIEIDFMEALGSQINPCGALVQDAAFIIITDVPQAYTASFFQLLRKRALRQNHVHPSFPRFHPGQLVFTAQWARDTYAGRVEHLATTLWVDEHGAIPDWTASIEQAERDANLARLQLKLQQEAQAIEALDEALASHNGQLILEAVEQHLETIVQGYHRLQLVAPPEHQYHPENIKTTC